MLHAFWDRNKLRVRMRCFYSNSSASGSLNPNDIAEVNTTFILLRCVLFFFSLRFSVPKNTMEIMKMSVQFTYWHVLFNVKSGMFSTSWHAVKVYGNIIVAELKIQKTTTFGLSTGSF